MMELEQFAFFERAVAVHKKLGNAPGGISSKRGRYVLHARNGYRHERIMGAPQVRGGRVINMVTEKKEAIISLGAKIEITKMTKWVVI